MFRVNPQIGFGAKHGPAPLPFSGAMVKRTSAQTITTGSTPATVTWQATEFDNGSFWSAGSPTRLTVAANGYAQVFGCIRWASVASQTMRYVRPLKNGSPFFGGGSCAFSAPASTASSRQPFMTAMVPVTAGDYFELEVAHDRGSNLDVNNDDQTYFGIRYLPTMDGALLKLTANEAITGSTLTYIPWDATVFDTMGVWTAGDPTKLTIPLTNDKRLRFYGGLRWLTAFAGSGFIDIDRDTGSRAGTAVATAQTLATTFGMRQNITTSLLASQYDGASGPYAGSDSLPNDYLLQVEATGSNSIRATEETYLGVEACVGLKATFIRLAANQSIATSTFTTVSWGNNVYSDDYGIFDAGQSDRLIVPSGYSYAIIDANVSWAGNINNDRLVQLLKNGSTFPGGACQMIKSGSVDAGVMRQNITTIAPVAAGDYLQVQVWQNTGSALNLVTGNTPGFGVTFIP